MNTQVEKHSNLSMDKRVQYRKTLSQALVDCITELQLLHIQMCTVSGPDVFMVLFAKIQSVH
jgi:hypothetical protein